MTIAERVLAISGMTCEKCVERVKDALSNLGVEGEVSLNDGKATVTYDTKSVSLEKILNDIRESGRPIHEFTADVVQGNS